MACQDHRPERPPVCVTGRAGTLPSGLREAFLAQMLRGPMLDELVVSPAGEQEDSPGEVWLQTLTLTLSARRPPLNSPPTPRTTWSDAGNPEVMQAISCLWRPLVLDLDTQGPA